MRTVLICGVIALFYVGTAIGVILFGKSEPSVPYLLLSSITALSAAVWCVCFILAFLRDVLRLEIAILR